MFKLLGIVCMGLVLAWVVFFTALGGGVRFVIESQIHPYPCPAPASTWYIWYNHPNSDSACTNILWRSLCAGCQESTQISTS